MPQRPHRIRLRRPDRPEAHRERGDQQHDQSRQAGAYVRERVQQRQRLLGDAGKDLKLAKERMDALEKERNTAHAQLQTASELLAKAKGGVPIWAVAAAFAIGAALAYLIRG